MPVSIKGSGGGSVTLDAGAAATDTTLTLPNTTGTVALTASPTFTGTVTIPTLSVTSNETVGGTLSVTGASTLTGTVTATTITSPSATALTIQSAGTTAMTVDTSQNVGIGTTSPVARLDVASTDDCSVLVRSSGAGDYSAALSCGGTPNVAWGTGGSLAFATVTNNTAQTSFSEKMRIDSSGNLLIGRTTNPSGLSNGLYVLGTYSNTTPSAANVFINTDGSFFRSTSSLRYKANVQDATHGLADLLKLRSVTYNGKNDRDAQTVFGGFIAEEVDAAGLNEFVVYDEDGKPDALQYGNMVALMAKSIQELSAKNDALEARLAALEAK